MPGSSQVERLIADCIQMTGDEVGGLKEALKELDLQLQAARMVRDVAQKCALDWEREAFFWRTRCEMAEAELAVAKEEIDELYAGMPHQ